MLPRGALQTGILVLTPEQEAEVGSDPSQGRTSSSPVDMGALTPCSPMLPPASRSDSAGAGLLLSQGMGALGWREEFLKEGLLACPSPGISASLWTKPRAAGSDSGAGPWWQSGQPSVERAHLKD